MKVTGVRKLAAWTLLSVAGLAHAIDFTPHGTQPGLNYSMVGAASCNGCHQDVSQPDYYAFMPWGSWSGSLMANATRDPLFWAALDIANNDFPGAGDFCLRCHTPNGWLAGRVKNGIGGEDGCDLTGDLISADSSANDYQGVSCQFCHRLDPEGPAGEAHRTGGDFWLDDEDCDGAGEPCRKGPYDYTDGGGSTPPHAWVKSSFVEEGQFCGTCHDVSSPETDEGVLKTLILADGTDTGIAFPVERTYSEWQQSLFADLIFDDRLGDQSTTAPAISKGQTCQSCHMPVSEDPDALACVFDAPGRRTGELPVHRLVGGNTWIPQVLKGEYGGPGQLDRETAFDNTTQWATELLQSAAELDVTLGTIAADVLPVTVKVTNLSGHKLPTGYAEGRRMWIHVEARDNNDAVIFESAAYNGATGELTIDGQAKLYEVVHGEWDSDSSTCVTHDGSNRRQFHFVLSDCIALDNRIPPLGFTGANDLETQPVGYSYPSNPDGTLVNYDETSYAIAVPAATPLPVTVTAKLYFQTSSREYIEFLRDQAIDNSFPSENTMCDRTWSDGPADKSRGQFMYDLWEAYDRSPPVEMASSSEETAP